jgi:hypothetical protein
LIDFIRNETTLMAYADGELDPALAAALEEQMKSDPRLLSELVGFIRTRRMARHALLATREKIQPSWVDTVLAGRPAPAARRSFYKPFLIAAGIAVAAFFGGTLADGLGSQGPLPLLESAAFSRALDSQPSGWEGAVAEQNVRLVGTFQGASGLCREAEISGKAPRTNAVMCKKAGGWTAALTVAAPERAYEPAAGPDIVDSYLQGIGVERVPSDQEMRALGGRS